MLKDSKLSSIVDLYAELLPLKQAFPTVIFLVAAALTIPVSFTTCRARLVGPGSRTDPEPIGSGFGSKNLHLIGSGSGSGFEILFFIWPESGSKESFYKNNIIFLVYF